MVGNKYTNGQGLRGRECDGVSQSIDKNRQKVAKKSYDSVLGLAFTDGNQSFSTFLENPSNTQACFLSSNEARVLTTDNFEDSDNKNIEGRSGSARRWSGKVRWIHE